MDFELLLNLNLITILTPAPGMNGPRLRSDHFYPSDIVVTEKATKLKSSALPKRENIESSDISNDVLLVSRDGVNFPNSTNLARRSPMIRNLLGDCPSEEATIIIDIESNILNTVLELLNESSPTFPSRLLESVKEALELFKIDDAVLVEEVRSQPRKLSKQRKKTVKGLEDGATDTIQDVDKYEDNNESKAKDSVEVKNVIIVCPYEGCQKKLKGKDSFWKHLCLIHHKKELEQRLVKLDGGKFKCPQNLCQLESNNKGFVISHFGIRHNVIIDIFTKNFPKHTVVKNI